MLLEYTYVCTYISVVQEHTPNHLSSFAQTHFTEDGNISIHRSAKSFINVYSKKKPASGDSDNDDDDNDDVDVVRLRL
jgi:hypothetical protein